MSFTESTSQNSAISTPISPAETAANRALVTKIMDGLARGDGAAFVAAMHADFVWRPMGHGAWGRVYRGKRAVLSELFAVLYEQYESAPTTTARHIWADGDRVIVEADGHVVTKAGPQYNNRYCMIFHLAGGQMLEVREYLDTQLSAEVLSPIPAQKEASPA